MNAEHKVKKRRVLNDRLGPIISRLRAAGTSPPILNTLDFLSIESSELLKICETHNISLSFQEVQQLKTAISVTLHSGPPVTNWSSLPNLLPTQDSHHHYLPRKLFFGNFDLDSLFPSLPHPSVLELVESHGEDCGGHEGESVNITHHVAMTLALASAARGARVLLIDTGIGTVIEQLMMQKCAAFCQGRSDTDVEQLLGLVSVQRCYDPFLLLQTISLLPSLPLHSKPDVVILVDWLKSTLPFMTESDAFQHKRYSGVEAKVKEGKHSSGKSLLPLLAEALLLLQKLARPCASSSDHQQEHDGGRSSGAGCSKAATSVVILNASRHIGISATSSGGSSTQSPFSSLLADCVDYSVLLRARQGPTNSPRQPHQYFAEIRKSPEMSSTSFPSSCSFSV